MSDITVNKYLYLYGNVRNRIGGIVISYSATLKQIEQLYKQPFYDENLSRWENKERMKSQAVAIWGYEAFLKEMTFVSLSKTVEDSIVDLKVELGIKVDIWKDPFDYEVRHLEDVRVIRNLNNVVKHHRGVIYHSKTHDGIRLSKSGFEDGIHVKDLEFDYLDYARRTYIFLIDLINSVTSSKLTSKNVPNTKDEFVENFLPKSLRDLKSS